jgi:hypothetical protein
MKMKRVRIVSLLIAALTALALLVSCGMPCTQHVDADHDLKCDKCRAKVACTEHEDEDGDEKCDKCGERVEKPEASLPDISAVKVADYLPSDTLNIGDVVTYTITITNSGDKGATVTLTKENAEQFVR